VQARPPSEPPTCSPTGPPPDCCRLPVLFTHIDRQHVVNRSVWYGLNKSSSAWCVHMRSHVCSYVWKERKHQVQQLGVKFSHSHASLANHSRRLQVFRRHTQPRVLPDGNVIIHEACQGCSRHCWQCLNQAPSCASSAGCRLCGEPGRARPQVCEGAAGAHPCPVGGH